MKKLSMSLLADTVIRQRKEKHMTQKELAEQLHVTDKDADRLVCEVCNNGVIKGKKSINVPDVHINLPSLTEKDRIFIRWAIDADIDFIAHSFVRSKDDLAEIQSMLDEARSHIKIISKIENQQGIDNLDEILHHCYGVMIARGDLGVEIPEERIPLIQKEIVQRCRVFRNNRGFAGFLEKTAKLVLTNPGF